MLSQLQRLRVKSLFVLLDLAGKDPCEIMGCKVRLHNLDLLSFAILRMALLIDVFRGMLYPISVAWLGGLWS
jgi:hypothetical protein